MQQNNDFKHSHVDIPHSKKDSLNISAEKRKKIFKYFYL